MRRTRPRVKAALVGLLGRVLLVSGLQVDLEGLPVALHPQRQAVVAPQVQVQPALRLRSTPYSTEMRMTCAENKI